MAKKQKLYLPSLAELIDRISIAQHKECLNHEHKAEFTKEINLILNDIDIDLDAMGKENITASFIRDIVILTMANSLIWTHEDAIRSGAKGKDDLYFTHQINDLRSQAKKKIMQAVGGRIDYKLNNIKAENKFVPSGY